MLEEDADLAIVVGGYKSSNTSHLVELCENKLPTYYIDSAERLLLKMRYGILIFIARKKRPVPVTCRKKNR